MRSKLTKLAASVLVAVAVLGVMGIWPGGPTNQAGNEKWWLGPSAAWGQEITEALDTVKAVTCREQTVWISPDGTKHKSSTWDVLSRSSDSYRRDIYNMIDGEDVLTETQWYVPEGDGMVQTNFHFELKCYGSYRHVGSFGNGDPVSRLRFYVQLLDDADQLLGEKTIEGRNCVGFEISAAKYGINPAEWVDRIWFDVDTKLPVLRENVRLHPRDKTQKDYHPLIRIQDRFDYDPQLPADHFVPGEIPEGFVEAHPDQIRGKK